MNQAYPRCPSLENPTAHGLWSLWDMLDHYSFRFVHVMERLGELDGAIVNETEANPAALAPRSDST
jgi:hypothetical protein